MGVPRSGPVLARAAIAAGDDRARNSHADMGPCNPIGSGYLGTGLNIGISLDPGLATSLNFLAFGIKRFALACFGGNLQACSNQCNSEYRSCQLKEGLSGWLCLGFGPTPLRHGGDTCGSFGSDVCLHNKGWCQLGCQASCVGPYPPTIVPPPAGPPH
jgi:hypothetical protein